MYRSVSGIAAAWSDGPLAVALVVGRWRIRIRMNACAASAAFTAEADTSTRFLSYSYMYAVRLGGEYSIAYKLRSRVP
jgi:hypothetical protein